MAKNRTMRLGKTVIEDKDNAVEFIFEYFPDRDRYDVTRRHTPNQPTRTRPISETGWVKDQFASASDEIINSFSTAIEGKTGIPYTVVLGILRMTKSAIAMKLCVPTVYPGDAKKEVL